MYRKTSYVFYLIDGKIVYLKLKSVYTIYTIESMTKFETSPVRWQMSGKTSIINIKNDYVSRQSKAINNVGDGLSWVMYVTHKNPHHI